MSSDGHDPTIRDYLRELRQQRWLILAVTVIAALLGLGYSVAQSTSYSATATVAVRDPNQDLTVLGSPGASNQSPLQLADAHAQRVNRLLVAQRAKADLGGEGPALEQLQKSIDVSVDPTSSLVSIAAKAHTATLAAAIANAFAREDVNQSTIEARQTYAQAARRLSQKIGPPGRTQQATRALYGEQLSRLQALSSFARPAEVSQLAAVPSSPSAPRPVRNTLAAALFGLMLGFATRSTGACAPRTRSSGISSCLCWVTSAVRRWAAPAASRTGSARPRRPTSRRRGSCARTSSSSRSTGCAPSS
jgi:uncharacterized protein involved in exopolysaccharide biosynthesis